jgi:hypothetical protein
MRMPGEASKVARVSSPLPVAMRRAASLALALLASGLASCASSGLADIAPANVAPDRYQSMTCERMKFEVGRLNGRKADLAPALFPSISEQEREHQIAEINGELKTLSLVSSEKCNTPR